MKRISIATLVLAAALCAPAAYADAPPARGAYLLVDPVLDDVADHSLPPIYIHMTLDSAPDGGHMEFRFILPRASLELHGPGSDECEQSGRCLLSVNALGLDFVVTEDGRIAVTEADMRTGPDMTMPEAEEDADAIIDHVVALVDGAVVNWSEDEIVLAPQDWSQGGTVRFLAGDLDAAQGAIFFPILFGQTLPEVGHCVVRQLMTIVAADPESRSAADAELLEIMRIVDLSFRLHRQSHLAAADPDRNPGEVRTMEQRDLMLALTIYGGYFDTDEPVAAAVYTAMHPARSLGEAYGTIRAEFIEPEMAGIVAARRYHMRIRNIEDQGLDPVAAICKSVHLRF